MFSESQNSHWSRGSQQKPKRGFATGVRPAPIVAAGLPFIRPTTKPPLPDSSNTYLPSPVSSADEKESLANAGTFPAPALDMDWTQHPPRRSSETDKRPLELDENHSSKFRRHNSQPCVGGQVPQAETLDPFEDTAPSQILPTVLSNASDAIKRINAETVGILPRSLVAWRPNLAPPCFPGSS